jgi:hypothetical protein
MLHVDGARLSDKPIAATTSRSTCPNRVRQPLVVRLANTPCVTCTIPAVSQATTAVANSR